MKQKTLLVLLLTFSLFQGNLNTNATNSSGNNFKGANSEIIRQETNIVRNTSLKQKNRKTKKDLKKEIKRLKKYHKSLLSLYNRNFEEKYLELIKKNSGKLSELRSVF